MASSAETKPEKFFKLSTEMSVRGNDILVYRHQGKAIKFQRKDRRGTAVRWRCVTCKLTKTPGQRLIKVTDGTERYENGVRWQFTAQDPTIGHNFRCAPQSLSAHIAEQSMRAASRDARDSFATVPSLIAQEHEARIPALVKRERALFPDEADAIKIGDILMNFNACQNQKLASRLAKAQYRARQEEMLQASKVNTSEQFLFMNVSKDDDEESIDGLNVV